MTRASDLLQRHLATLVDDTAQWQTLIADDVVWEQEVVLVPEEGGWLSEIPVLGEAT